jgi:hypothetical protein
VWLYHVFSSTLRDVELILAERGVVVTMRAFGTGVCSSVPTSPNGYADDDRSLVTPLRSHAGSGRVAGADGARANRVVCFLEAVSGLKHRAALTTVYAAGLRASAVASPRSPTSTAAGW